MNQVCQWQALHLKAILHVTNFVMVFVLSGLLFRCESAGQPQHSDSGDSPRVWDVVVGLSNEPWWKGWLNFIYMMKRSSWWKIKAFSTNLDWCFWHFVFSVLWISLSQLHVWSPMCDLTCRFTQTMNITPMDTNHAIFELFIADVTYLSLSKVDTLYMLAHITATEELLAIWTFDFLIVMNLTNVTS